GYRRARPPGPRRPAVPLLQKVDPQHPLQPNRRPAPLALGIRTAADDRPAAPTAPPAPSRPKTCHAASAFSSRRIPPAKSCTAAASSCPLVPHPCGRFYQSDRRKCAFFQCFLREFVPALENPRDFVDKELEPYADAYKEILDRRFESHTLTDEINRILTHLSRLDNFDWQPAAIHVVATHRQNPTEALRFLTDLERLAYMLFLARETPTDRIARYGKVLEEMEAGRDLFANGSSLQLSDDEKRNSRDALNGEIYSITRIVQPVLLRLDEAIGAGGATYDYPIISVEHVLPQNPSLDSRWLIDFPDEQVRNF